VQLATIQELARYWATDYDWRKCEAKLNALPQFKTEIDGVDIHFIHVKSPHADALPLIITHGALAAPPPAEPSEQERAALAAIATMQTNSGRARRSPWPPARGRGLSPVPPTIRPAPRKPCSTAISASTLARRQHGSTDPANRS
jgi:Epoxide hydrolase N terminus